jgi:putative FmdB family regulatory protein
MPTYEYECSKGHQFEVEQRISDQPLKTCKVCRSKVRRLISATSFILKGSGWYSDGYSSSKGNGSASGDGSSPEPKSPSSDPSSVSSSDSS